MLSDFPIMLCGFTYYARKMHFLNDEKRWSITNAWWFNQTFLTDPLLELREIFFLSV